jgi:hypothetical protein
MSVLWNFNVAVEFASSIVFLHLGLSGSLYAYGFRLGEGPSRYFRWRSDFRGTLRWLAPLLVVLSLAALLIQVREWRISSLGPNPAAPLDSGRPVLFAFLARCPAASEPQFWASSLLYLARHWPAARDVQQ